MTEKSEKVSFAPPKSLFVKSLVRDIELDDAILDLLDNCVDGILRQLRKKKIDSSSIEAPYEGFHAHLTIDESRFIIEDNCGGIPKNTALNYAFRMGRVKNGQDEDIETVGMYGIGMKRAIFKMGERAEVYSQDVDDTYSVTITPEWLSDEDDWEIPLKETDKLLSENGTRISITSLLPNIARKFNVENSNFVADLKSEISKLFSVILRKGFSIIVNGEAVKPKEVLLMAPDDACADGHESVEPYLFRAKMFNVDVELAIGFYRPLASAEEIDGEQIEKKTSENAGWSIICNDRLVLYADKSHITGWGTAGVPNYHTQFISIAGVVNFKSSDAQNLPLNSTKRGLDTSSEIYAVILDIMREGIRIFIDYTNKWKGRTEETADDFKGLTPRKLQDIVKRSSNNQTSWTKVRKLKDRSEHAEKYIPSLRLPSKESKIVRISFTKSKSEVDFLKAAWFEDLDHDGISASEVGEAAFDYCAEGLREDEEERDF